MQPTAQAVGSLTIDRASPRGAKEARPSRKTAPMPRLRYRTVPAQIRPALSEAARFGRGSPCNTAHPASPHALARRTCRTRVPPRRAVLHVDEGTSRAQSALPTLQADLPDCPKQSAQNRDHNDVNNPGHRNLLSAPKHRSQIGNASQLYSLNSLTRSSSVVDSIS
jgi:hypothetical protein